MMPFLCLALRHTTIKIHQKSCPIGATITIYGQNVQHQFQPPPSHELTQSTHSFWFFKLPPHRHDHFLLLYNGDPHSPSRLCPQPLHYAIALADHATLNKILSTLPKLCDPIRVQSESQSLAQEHLAEQISAALDRRDNPLKETPLHLAVRLNDAAAARALAAAGANISLQNAAGWNPLQEALLRRCPEIVAPLVQHHHLAAWSKWRRRLPRLVAGLRRMRDFYMEISFHFESSVVPFVGKIAPSDTYKIWKRDGNLRADTSLAGYDGLKIQRANQSFLFLNDFDYDNTTDIDVPHDYFSPTFARLPLEIGRRHSSFVREDREFVTVSRKSVDIIPVDSRRRAAPPYAGDRLVAPPPTKEKEYAKSLRPMVWLTEQFPLKTEELLPLLDILVNKVKAVRRMRELLTTTFPPGTFPVKVAIPVVPTVRVVITFTKFVELQPVEKFYTPLSSPRQFGNGRGSEKESRSGDNGSSYLSFSSSSWLRGGSQQHQQSSSSGREVVDPFAIPSGYSWSSFDEKKRKMKKSKSTRRTKQATMATDGPSWADQWGEGGFGAIPDENKTSNKDVGADKKPASAGFGKAKSVATAGAQKVKNGTSMAIKWVKTKCQKKSSST
ncbi:UNVERIFIED_CONTAM: Ankyrin repeat domain-containing protein 13C-B [Sesamum calycinum]|uniref:Ankyrin repeat domain-containing protein 13C-B n=1 Tax=Sesamum calycinum TaxID=2727403 RepID=A0AAW2Q5R0_9LAMI